MTDNIRMTSNQPYLLRAFYDWIVDNDLTPYIVVNATMPGVQVPEQFVKDGQIVLNISPSACVHFELDVQSLSFQARFGGQPHRIYMPTPAVLAIYARENGAGTVFTQESEELGSEAVTAEPKAASEAPKKAKPTLKVVK
jgi:stringent starvation protein B